MTGSVDRIVRALGRCYGGILAVYPSEFRGEYGAEMLEFFRDDCRRAARIDGLGGLAILGLRTLADLALTAPGVHMEILRQDLRFAIRLLWKSPGLAATAVLALALGIGANSAIFSLVHGILLAPLPFSEPDRLVMVWERNPRGIDRNSVSPPNFVDYQAQAKSLAGIAAFYETSANLAAGGDPEHLDSAVVSPQFFTVMGVAPLMGRGVDQQGVVLSYGLWQRRFGLDPNIVGRALQLDGMSYTVRGVMAPGFRFGTPEVAIWRAFDPAGFSRHARFLRTVARLRPGVSIVQARAELESVAAGLADRYPESNRGWGTTVVGLKEQMVGDMRRPLVVLLGAVGLVLLIACANVANLLLARSTHRQPEMAVRRALGANTGRIVRQMLTESVLLASIGGTAALGLSCVALEALRTLRPAGIPRLDELGVNGWAVAFTFAIALAAGLLAGLAPALGVSRPDRKSFAGSRLRAGLIVAEVALSVTLALGAGLLVRSFSRLNSVDPGFRAEGAFTLTVDAGKRPALLTEVVERVRALPGVESAGMISNAPLTGGEGSNRFGFSIDGSPDASSPRFYARWITPGYLQSMSIPLLHGRDFSRIEKTPVVIVDAALAKRHFPNQDPVGKFLRLSYDAGRPREIVGVAGEVRLVALDREPAPQVYIPFEQEMRPSMTLVVRGGIPAAAVRAEIRRIDGSLPVYDIRPMQQRVAESIAPQRFNTLLMSLLAGLALALAAVGIYGVIASMVGERVHEMGIRMALGARPRAIVLLVVRQGMKLATLGIAVGLAAATLVTQALAKLLFEVTPLDAWTFAAVPALAAVVALAACVIPARGAAKVDPARALRAS